MGELYILNAPIITSYGVFSYRKATVEEARRLISSGEFISAVGHEETAQLLTRLLGRPIPASRVKIKMKPGDKALVFRVLTRLPEGAILSREELEKIPYELGILEIIGIKG